MIFDPNPGREIQTTTTLDDGDIWREITRVARAALREGDDGDATASLSSRLRAALPDGETWDIRTQPLLHAGEDRSVVVVAIERVVQAAAVAEPPVMTVSMAAPAAPAASVAPPAPRAGAPEPQVEEIRHRFGLSQRQAEVAALLARRLTDKEIASRLGVSRHTARRHVELTMIRLRVHSRAQVGDLLAGAA